MCALPGDAFNTVSVCAVKKNFSFPFRLYIIEDYNFNFSEVTFEQTSRLPSTNQILLLTSTSTCQYLKQLTPCHLQQPFDNQRQPAQSLHPLHSCHHITTSHYSITFTLHCMPSMPTCFLSTRYPSLAPFCDRTSASSPSSSPPNPPLGSLRIPSPHHSSHTNGRSVLSFTSAHASSSCTACMCCCAR